ncbi:MAG: HypC/HybG/HupF family hydrogenase formation chaperone [Candidatus Omnitrophica bacterium]|nr:HypC/HybG/HupF family hydrogenase formation chaperone [Candidatus Omnitrophota bacterium]
MCYAIPGKIHRIEAKGVVVDYFGEHKFARNELIALLPGDYVLAQGGYVIQKIDSQEARKSLADWEELFFALKEIDRGRTTLSNALPPGNSRGEKILKNVLADRPLSDADAGFLLELADEKTMTSLYQTANVLRQRQHSNSCCVHGIIEISNQCLRGCRYCGISTWNRDLKRYRMTKAEILQAVYEAVEVYGFKSLVLQSGEAAGYGLEELADITREIKRRHAVLLIISFGEIGVPSLRLLYDAGCRGLLLRFETSNPDLFAGLRPGSTLEKRLAELRAAADIGYFLITGGLLGLPGQTISDIVQDIRLAASLSPEMLSFGPFLPHPGTPLAEGGIINETLMFKSLAVARMIANPQAKILVTTAFETLSPLAREKGLQCGGSSVMLNATPLVYRPLYSLYPNRAHAQETISCQIKATVDLLKSLGRAPTDLGI